MIATKHHATDYRGDDLDRRILYTLMKDSRNATAASLAEQANVSGRTIRNRIRNPETEGSTRGYFAQIDFERDETELTPHGDTIVQPHDIVTVLSQGGADANAFDAIRAHPPKPSTES